MTTVASFIDSARYDLRDYQTGLEFDDTELVEYINRMGKALNSQLVALNSDLVHGTATLTLTANAKSIALSTLNSGNWDSIRSVWYGPNKKLQTSLDIMYYKQELNKTYLDSGDSLVVGNTYQIINRTTLDFTTCGASANTAGTIFVCTVVGTLGTSDACSLWVTGEPDYWAVEGETMLFDIITPTTMYLICHYNTLLATMTASSNMPYSDRFNEYFRELLVMHAKAKKEGNISKVEQMYDAVFRRIALETTIRRNFVPKYYKKDF